MSRQRTAAGSCPDLQSAYTAARKAWPSLNLPLEAFASAVERSAPGGEERARLHLEDLYLATAVACGIPGAAEELDRRYLAGLGAALGSFGGGAPFLDEVRQALRERFYGARSKAERGIASYSGQGPLSAWVRACAVRAATRIAQARGRPASSDPDELLDQKSSDPDPELAFLKQTYRREFRAAFQAALAHLTPRERTLLRLQIIDGLTGAQMAAALGMSAPTVSRGLASARQTLLRETRRALTEKLQLTRSQSEGVWGLVESQLELSLSRLLK